MANQTNITFEGRCIATPELKFSQAGKAFARFRMAHNRRTLNKNTNEWEDAGSDFLDVTAFGSLAEKLVESVDKGTLVLVMGDLKSDQWEDKEGNKRTSWGVIADTVAVNVRDKSLGGGAGAQGGGWGQSAAAPAQADPWGISNAESPF